MTMPTLPVHCSGIRLAGSCGCSLSTACDVSVASFCALQARACLQAATPRRRPFATNTLTHGLCRAALMIMAALVVGSSTAGSFSGYDSAPQAFSPDDFEADQSRERSADRSRPSRDRVTHVDNAPHGNSPQDTQPPHKAPPAAPPRRDAATAAAAGAPPRKPTQ